MTSRKGRVIFEKLSEVWVLRSRGTFPLLGNFFIITFFSERFFPWRL